MQPASKRTVEQYLRRDVPQLLERIRAIHRAVSEDDVRALESQLQSPDYALARDHLGMTPLHRAVVLGRHDVARPAHRPLSGDHQCQGQGRTALHYAAAASRRSGRADMYRLLLQNGSDPRIRDNRGKSSEYYKTHHLPMAPEVAQLTSSARTKARSLSEPPGLQAPQRTKGDPAEIRELILEGHGRHLLGRTSWNEEVRHLLKGLPQFLHQVSDVHDSISRGDVERLKELAASDAQLLRARSDLGCHPIHAAIEARQLEAARLILEAFPAAINLKAPHGRNPLHLAALRRDPEMYKFLVESGADPRALDQKGKTAEFYLKSSRRRRSRSQASAHLASRERSSSVRDTKPASVDTSARTTEVDVITAPADKGALDGAAATGSTAQGSQKESADARSDVAKGADGGEKATGEAGGNESGESGSTDGGGKSSHTTPPTPDSDVTVVGDVGGDVVTDTVDSPGSTYIEAPDGARRTDGGDRSNEEGRPEQDVLKASSERQPAEADNILRAREEGTEDVAAENGAGGAQTENPDGDPGEYKIGETIFPPAGQGTADTTSDVKQENAVADEGGGITNTEEINGGGTNEVKDDDTNASIAEGGHSERENGTTNEGDVSTLGQPHQEDENKNDTKLSSLASTSDVQGQKQKPQTQKEKDKLSSVEGPTKAPESADVGDKLTPNEDAKNNQVSPPTTTENIDPKNKVGQPTDDAVRSNDLNQVNEEEKSPKEQPLGCTNDSEDKTKVQKEKVSAGSKRRSGKKRHNSGALDTQNISEAIGTGVKEHSEQLKTDNNVMPPSEGPEAHLPKPEDDVTTNAGHEVEATFQEVDNPVSSAENLDGSQPQPEKKPQARKELPASANATDHDAAGKATPKEGNKNGEGNRNGKNDKNNLKTALPKQVRKSGLQDSRRSSSMASMRSQLAKKPSQLSLRGDETTTTLQIFDDANSGSQKTQSNTHEPASRGMGQQRVSMRSTTSTPSRTNRPVEKMSGRSRTKTARIAALNVDSATSNILMENSATITASNGGPEASTEAPPKLQGVEEKVHEEATEGPTGQQPAISAQTQDDTRNSASHAEPDDTASVEDKTKQEVSRVKGLQAVDTASGDGEGGGVSKYAEKPFEEQSEGAVPEEKLSVHGQHSDIVAEKAPTSITRGEPISEQREHLKQNEEPDASILTAKPDVADGGAGQGNATPSLPSFVKGASSSTLDVLSTNVLQNGKPRTVQPRQQSTEKRPKNKGSKLSSSTSAQLDRLNELIDVWIKEGDLLRLEHVVIAGQGDRLLNRTSDDKQVQEFLGLVPAYMEGRTPLHYAAVVLEAQNYFDILKKAGADDTIKDKVPAPQEPKPSDVTTQAKGLEGGGGGASRLPVEEPVQTAVRLPLPEEAARQGLPPTTTAGHLPTALPNNKLAQSLLLANRTPEEAQYLRASVGDALAGALLAVAQQRPQDPVAFIASWLKQRQGKDRFDQPSAKAPSLPAALPEQHSKNRDENTASRANTVSSSATRTKKDRRCCTSRPSHAHSEGCFYALVRQGQALLAERDARYRTARDVAREAQQRDNLLALDAFVLDAFLERRAGLLRALAHRGYEQLLHATDRHGRHLTAVLAQCQLTDMQALVHDMDAFFKAREELHAFVRNGYLEGMQQLVRRDVSLVTAKGTKGRCALHVAVLVENPDVVRHLVAACPDALHVADNKMRTPSYFFIYKQEILKLKEEESPD
ncbi:hypothetical protein HPB48_020709 [Haemaphysalis longicornis]|uniref:Uncharacterized protein n=1 Tax=Haemaphysalis longicornis TaxID=44386 RepID=A0A9J6FXN5_HAELO|nr:hypothetical protein HPB48_020709 [Haemaphysalis longicornis]